MKTRLLALILLMFSIVGFAAPERSVTVSGHCLNKVQPDRGTVTLVAQFVDKSAPIAAKKASNTYEALRKAVQKLGLKDLELQTSEYSIQEDVDYSSGKKVSRGMRAALGLQVTTSEIKRLGEVIALSSQHQVNRVENMGTFLSPEKTKESQEACLMEAIKNARSKAEKMSSTAKASLGEVISIEEGARSEAPRPYMEMSMASAKMGGAEMDTSSAPNVESKSQTISVNVQVKFALK